MAIRHLILLISCLFVAPLSRAVDTDVLPQFQFPPDSDYIVFDFDQYNNSIDTFGETFSFASFGFTLGGYGMARGGYTAQEIAKHCVGGGGSIRNGPVCVKHAVEAGSALLISTAAGFGGAGGQGSQVVDRAMNSINMFKGNQESGGNSNDKAIGKRYNCPDNREATTGQIRAHINVPNMAIKTSCESSCMVKRENSKISDVLGQMANYVVDHNLGGAQFTLVSTSDNKAIARCAVDFLDHSEQACPRDITGDGCDTNIA